ncbi:MAG: hypothetical protein ACM3JD_19215, partial [Rudaea sp.]
MSATSVASPLRLLLLDPDPAFADRLGKLCAEASSPGLALTWAKELAAAEKLLRARPFDALLLGADSASRPSLTPFAQLQKSATNLPIILLTTADDDDTS